MSCGNKNLRLFSTVLSILGVLLCCGIIFTLFLILSPTPVSIQPRQPRIPAKRKAVTSPQKQKADSKLTVTVYADDTNYQTVVITPSAKRKPALDRSRICARQMQEIWKAMDDYATYNNQYPQTLEEMIPERISAEKLKCPHSGEPYIYTWVDFRKAPGTQIILRCKGCPKSKHMCNDGTVHIAPR